MFLDPWQSDCFKGILGTYVFKISWFNWSGHWASYLLHGVFFWPRNDVWTQPVGVVISDPFHHFSQGERGRRGRGNPCQRGLPGTPGHKGLDVSCLQAWHSLFNKGSQWNIVIHDYVPSRVTWGRKDGKGRKAIRGLPWVLVPVFNSNCVKDFPFSIQAILSIIVKHIGRGGKGLGDQRSSGKVRWVKENHL